MTSLPAFIRLKMQARFRSVWWREKYITRPLRVNIIFSIESFSGSSDFCGFRNSCPVEHPTPPHTNLPPPPPGDIRHPTSWWMQCFRPAVRECNNVHLTCSIQQATRFSKPCYNLTVSSVVLPLNLVSQAFQVMDNSETSSSNDEGETSDEHDQEDEQIVSWPSDCKAALTRKVLIDQFLDWTAFYSLFLRAT